MHPKFNDTVAALQQKIALLERKLALKQALDTPPINQKAPVETPADEVDGEKMTPEEIRAAKASVKSEQKVEEKEEECSSGMYESSDENEEESEGENGETPTPTAPCSAVAIPKKLQFHEVIRSTLVRISVNTTGSCGTCSLRPHNFRTVEWKQQGALFISYDHGMALL